MNLRIFLLLPFLLLFFLPGSLSAQITSPRTGQPPKKDYVSRAEFDKYPPEIQEIIKNNPQLYSLEKPVVEVDAAEFRTLPREKQQYMLDHPAEYRIVEREGANLPKEADPAIFPPKPEN